MPPFGPSLPSPPHFTNHKEFREFLLVKCMCKQNFVVFLNLKHLFTLLNKVINGEKSSFNNTVFGKRRKRTIEAILKNLQIKYDPSNIKSSSSLLTPQMQQQHTLATNKNGTMSKKMREELRKAEFLRAGQVSLTDYLDRSLAFVFLTFFFNFLELQER